MMSRPLSVLLDIAGIDVDEPLIMDRVVEAFQAGSITRAETRWLQSFERRSSKSRKRALMESADVSPAAIAEMRAKLSEMRAKLERQQRASHGL